MDIVKIVAFAIIGLLAAMSIDDKPEK